jgi:hypothetical protein
MAESNQQLNVTIATHADTSGVTQVQNSLRQLATQSQQQLSAQQQVANTVLRQSMAQVPQTLAAFESQRRAVEAQVGARPTLAPEDIGISSAAARATQTREVARVTSDATVAVRAHAEAQQQLEGRARLTAGEVVRFTTAAIGLGTGLSIASTAGHLLESGLTNIVQQAIATDQSMRNLTATFGTAATQYQQFVATASRQAGGFGENDLRAAVEAVRPLGEQFNLTTNQLEGLVSSAQKLATIRDVPLADALGAMQAALLGNATAADKLGLSMSDQQVAARAAGGAYRQTFDVLSDGEKTMLRYVELLKQVDTQQLRVADSGPSVATRAREIENAVNRLNSEIGKGPMSGLLELFGALGAGMQTSADAQQRSLNQSKAQVQDWSTYVDSVVKDTQDKILSAAGTPPPRVFGPAPLTGAETTGSQVVAAAQQGLQQLRAASSDLMRTSDEQMAALANRQAEVEVLEQEATQRAMQSFGALTTVTQVALARTTDPAEQQTLQARLDLINRIAAARLVGEKAQQAGQFADRAATEANAQLQRIQLNQDERRLAVTDQIVAARRAELQVAGQISAIGLAQRTVQAQATLANDRLQSITLAENQRRLDVADQQADYARQSIQLQQQMAPLLLQQANLQDRITVASRDNLDIRKQLIAAQQAALPSQAALSELNYAQQRLQLQAQVRQAALIRGDRSGGGQPSFAELSRQFREGELNRPGVELAALDAQQPVARAQQASTAEGLGRQMQGADLEAQARALQDQLQPLQAAAREEQARGDALQRSLDLLDLQDTGAKTAAQSAINLAQQQLIAINQTLVPLQLQADAANAYGDAIQRSLELMNLGDEPAKAFWQAAGNAATALKLDSQEAATAASDYASNLNLGADPAEKIASALERGRDALQAINTMAAEGGAGMGAIAPGGSGVSFGGITVNVNGGITGASDTEAIVAEATREFEVQFRQALRSSGSAPPPVTSSLVGARRG